MLLRHERGGAVIDIVRAKKIIEALAEGVDPVTGELLPEDSVCNQGEVVRAFYAVLKFLSTKTGKERPENTGKPWTTEEDEQLISEYRRGLKTSEIGRLHKRSNGAITSRLLKLGETSL